MKQFFTPEPVIFFNSTAPGKFPGSTLEAIGAGFSDGADVACINIQYSKDREVMVISEPLLDNICDGAGAVSGYTCAELKRFDAGYRFMDDAGNYVFRGKGLKFNSLEEVLHAFPDKRFNITLMTKDADLVKDYAGIVRRNGAVDRVLTSSMYGKNIKLVRKLIPESATAFTLGGIISVYALFKSGLLYFVKRFKADAYQTPEAIGASYIANSGLIEQLHDKGVRVHVWDIKDRVQLKRVYNTWADGFMVSDAAMVKEFLKDNPKG